MDALPVSSDGQRKISALKNVSAFVINNPWFYLTFFGINCFLLIYTGLMDVDHLLASFEDDFYYYFVISNNLIHLGSLTFDGINETNGFHPLWFLIVTLIQYVIGNDELSFYSIKIISIVFSAIGSLLVIRYIRYRLGVEKLSFYMICIGFSYYVFSLILSVSGMEVALTLMLFPLFLQALASDVGSRRGLFNLTLFSMLIVLSRLDSALIILPVWILRFTAYGVSLFRVGGFYFKEFFISCTGIAVIFLPVFLYVVFNLIFFEGLLPQSGRAKAMVLEAGPYPALLKIIWWPPALIMVAFWLFVAIRFFVRVDSLKNLNNTCYILLLLWPLLFFLVLAYRSPWPLWSWYLYPFPAAILVGFLCLLDQQDKPDISSLNKVFGLFSGFFLFLLSVLAIAWVINVKPGASMLAAAQNIRTFAISNPGIYAMGDRAGIVGALLNEPLIQLEGLVGGRKVLQAIDRQENLLDFMREQGVDYYISTNIPGAGRSDCYFAAEPRQGGVMSKKMSATFCAKPVYEFSIRSQLSGNEVKTKIFAVDQLVPMEN